MNAAARIQTVQVVVLLLVLALLAACGDRSSDQSEDPPPQAAVPTGEPAPRSDPQPAPDSPGQPPLAAGLEFTLPAVGGGQVVGAELAGRDVALWFWAPW